MRMLSEIQTEQMRQLIAFERPEPIRTSEPERNSQYRIYRIQGRIYALEIALPSGWITEISEIREEDISKYV